MSVPRSKRPPIVKLAPGKGNYVRMWLSPEVMIAVGARFKTRGEQMRGERVELSFVHHPTCDEMDSYERLLGDAMEGDAQLFAREDAVEAAWHIVQPILGTVTPVHEYEPSTWGPAEADRLTADVGGWHCPTVAS